jgi:hypothetical protein
MGTGAYYLRHTDFYSCDADNVGFAHCNIPMITSQVMLMLMILMVTLTPFGIIMSLDIYQKTLISYQKLANDQAVKNIKYVHMYAFELKLQKV